MAVQTLADPIKEALVTKRAAEGTVKFSRSSLTDPHIQQLIKQIAQLLGESEANIINAIKEEEAEWKELADKSPILYNTIVINAVEGALFKLLWEKGGEDLNVEGAPKFDFVVFKRLIDYIKLEHDDFFPLRNLFSNRYLHNARIILVPSDNPENAKFNDRKTAAATEDGNFIFNTHFMQALLNYAHLKGITPSSKKYTNNGGDIPPEYAYIEFLIMHEFMHYTQADFHYQRLYNVSPMVINWVGDFRTNYLLVKSGYEQLPMGLFNDFINYDRQRTYKEMVDIVEKELEKLAKDELEKLIQQLDEFGDDHEEPEEDGDPGGGPSPEGGDPGGGPSPEGGDPGGGPSRSKPGQPGQQGKQGQPGKPGQPGQQGKQGQPGKPGQPGQQGKPGQPGQQGKPGQPGQQGKPGQPSKQGQPGQDKTGGSEPDRIPTEAEIEERARELEEKLSKKSDASPSQLDQELEKQKEKKAAEDSARRAKGGSNSSALRDDSELEFDFNNIKPKYSWRQLLSQVVKRSSNLTDETYQRIHPRAITSIHIAQQIGAGAIKPGEIPVEEDINLLIVVDSSGSMNDIIPHVYANLRNLIKQLIISNGIGSKIALIKYSNSFKTYKLDIKRNKYAKIDGPKDRPTVYESGTIEKLFTTTIGSSTNFSALLVRKLTEFKKAGYTVLIISDTDILEDGQNLPNLKHVYTHFKRDVFLLFDSRETFIRAVKLFGEQSKNISYIED